MGWNVGNTITIHTTKIQRSSSKLLASRAESLHESAITSSHAPFWHSRPLARTGPRARLFSSPHPELPSGSLSPVLPMSVSCLLVKRRSKMAGPRTWWTHGASLPGLLLSTVSHSMVAPSIPFLFQSSAATGWNLFLALTFHPPPLSLSPPPLTHHLHSLVGIAKQ